MARDYPEVALDVSLDDRFVDLINEGFDVVVRIGALKDSSLIARRLASCPFVVVASPQYLHTAGAPLLPETLLNHNVLTYTGNSGAP